MRWRAIVSISVLAFALAGSVGAQTLDEDWTRCEDAKNLDLAVDACTAIIDSGQETTSNLAWAYNDRGQAYHDKQQYNRAIQDYNRAIRLNPKFTEAFHDRGVAYIGKNEYPRAIQDLDEAIRLNPKFAEAFYIRSIAYYDKKEYDRAIQDCNRVIRLDPKFAEAYDERGIAYFVLQQYQSAIADFDRAIQLKPDLAEAYNDRGANHYRLQEYQSAIADFNQAIQLKPDLAEAYNGRRFAYANLEHTTSDSVAAAAKVNSRPPALAAIAPEPKPVEVTKLAVPAVTSQRRVALVIGNSNYVNVRSLRNPANDARLMARTLHDLGFTLVGGAAQIDLDKVPFDRDIQKFGAQAQGADVALFYYAGHGIQVKGLNYLVPVAANPTSEADAYFMVDAQAVLAQMDAGGSRLKVMILDACRNNPFGGRGFRSANGGLAPMEVPEGTLILYATAPGHVAQDGTGADSPFTQVLAETIIEPGKDIRDVFNDVGLAVAKSSGQSQVPWEANSPIEGKFYLAGGPTAP